MDWDCLVPHSLHYGLMWPVGIPTVFQTPVTVPMHNGRQMPAVRAVQRDCERVCVQLLRWPPHSESWYLEVLKAGHPLTIGLSTHPGTGVDGASVRGWKLADFLLKHVWFSSVLFKSYGEKHIEISRMPRGGHITYRSKIWSDLFLRNKSYRLLKLLVSSNDL